MQLAKSLQNIQPSYIREILDAANAPGVISLAGGLPDDKTFPLPLVAKSLSELSNRADLFQYGNTQGYTPLLEHIKLRYQLPNTHTGIVCTGSQQGLDLIARAFINPGDSIVMEAPSYLGAIQVFELAQANIECISQRADGPNLEELEACFSKKNISFLYAVPDFHNPTGVCWSLAIRQKVAQMCLKYDVAFIEDVPYRELRFQGDALPLVSSFCPNNSLVLRSYSKIATPGIRLGLVTGKVDWIAPLIKVKQAADLHSSIPMQAVLLDLLQHNNFNQHIEKLRHLYFERYKTLMDSITLNLPAYCHANYVEGGMFVWLSLPACNVETLAEEALRQGVAVVPSSVFYQKTSEASPALRLNFTNATKEELKDAIKRLSNVIEQFCKPIESKSAITDKGLTKD